MPKTPAGYKAILAAGAFVVSFLLASLDVRASEVVARPPSSVFDCNPGPWGNLEYVKITLEPPDQYAAESLAQVKETRWFFKGYDAANLTSCFHSLGLRASELQSVTQRSKWQQTTNGIWVMPGETFVLDLSPEIRVKLYTLLATFEENGFIATPFVFRPDMLKERFNYSRITEKTVALVKSLLYSKGSLLAFSDISAVLSHIDNQQEKIQLVKMLSRKSTLMLRLKLTEQSDVSRLLEYWGAGGRAKDLKPLLESLTRVDGGWEVDIAHLLPPFARKRLYTFPSPNRVQALPNENCHWSTLNFFNEPPDNSFLSAKRVQQAIDEEYDIVSGNKHLGDIILVMTSNDAILHSAVYVADDIVFTKTGGRENQPWILMKMEDMLPLYASANQPLKTVVCRKKGNLETPVLR